MKLTKTEESKLLSESLIALVVSLVILVGVFYTIQIQITKNRKLAAGVLESNLVLLDTNRRDAKEIKFLRENEQSIVTMWSTLKGWGGGVNLMNANPLVQAGLDNNIPIPPNKTPGNSTEYSGIKLFGNRTEFQRMTDALAAVESQQGLLQVRSATLQLPSTTMPNAEKPTFLDIQIELVAPLSK